MADGTSEGANIASKMGDGEANVWHWEGVQKTINQLYQRDMYHQKMVKDEYLKAQAQLATQAAGLRAADIPDFQKEYGGFREASLMLQDPRVYKNPEQRAYWSKLKDDRYASAMSLAEISKGYTKTKASYYDHLLQTGGLDASDNFHENMNQFDHQSSREIALRHSDNPMNFFNPKDDTPPPGEIRKGILGNTKSVEDAEPMLDAKGQRMGSYITKYSVASEYPLGMVANNAISYLKHKQLTKSVVDEFNSLPPEQAKASIDAANQLVQKETPNAPPLPYDYTGYYAAKWVNQARVKTIEADKAPKYDENYFKIGDRKQQWDMQNAREANENRRANDRLAFDRTKEANKQKRAAALFPDIDTKPVWEALQSNDRPKLKEYLGAIAKNNPEKTIPITISRLDIADPSTANGLLTSFGINPDTITYVKGRTPVETLDHRVRAVVDAINKISGGSKIKPEDLNRGQVIGGLIHLGTVNLYDGLHNYTGTKQTRLPVLFNAKNSSPEQLQAEISQEYVKKKKQYLEQQDADFEETGAGGATETTTTPPQAATTTPPPAATTTPPPAATTTPPPTATTPPPKVSGDDGWIKKIFHFEETRGSAAGTGLPNWGYNSRNPKTIDEAVGFFKKDILPKVANFPAGIKERMGDFLYNTGKDGRIYMLDQYLRKDGGTGLPDRGKYKEAMKDGEWKDAQAQKEFNAEWTKHKADIEKLPLAEQVKLADKGRDFYYQNINRTDGRPSPSYEKTWKHRLKIFDEQPAPENKWAKFKRH